MAHSTHGRHRAPGRHNSVTELSNIVTRAGVTGAKASALLAVSGGLVAAFALPASAAPESARSDVTSAAPARPVAAPAAPAISAPTAVSPARVELVGVFGVKAVAKPKPKPVVTVEQPRESRQVAAGERAETRVASRSSTRAATPATGHQTKRAVTRLPAPKAPSSSQIVTIARGLLGIRYVYGGSTTAGFDCSGFTQYVYKRAGITIPRTASAQQRAATRTTSPRPGDLVFYGSPASHVGIFTGGDMMIDSPKPGGSTSERHMYGTPTGFGRF